jgi:hypothetical protein
MSFSVTTGPFRARKKNSQYLFSRTPVGSLKLTGRGQISKSINLILTLWLSLSYLIRYIDRVIGYFVVNY